MLEEKFFTEYQNKTKGADYKHGWSNDDGDNMHHAHTIREINEGGVNRALHKSTRVLSWILDMT